MAEFIITKNTEKYGWCLFRLAGHDKQRAEKILERLKAENPNKELRIEEAQDKDCWWRQGNLD